MLKSFHMVSEKSSRNDIISLCILFFGLTWILLAYIVLLINKVGDTQTIFYVLGAGSFVLSLGAGLKLAWGYKWLPVFVIAGAILIAILTNVIYAILYLPIGLSA